MELGDWVQTVVGVVAIVVSVGVAVAVFRFERRDRTVDRLHERERERVEQATKEAERAAREERERWRSRHDAEVRSATACLDQLERVFDGVKRGALTREHMDSAGLAGLLDEVARIARSVPELEASLDDVWAAGSSLRVNHFPGVAQFRQVLSEEGDPVRLMDVVREATRCAVNQNGDAMAGLDAIARARAQIVEWHGADRPAGRP